MTQLLATADLHLGRRTILPGAETDTSVLSARSTWQALVDLAIRREVDAFLLVGDVIDEENKYLETFGPLESGLNRLAEHRIEVLMVAGNHDSGTLSDFAGRLRDETKAKVRILGAGGRWETYRMETGGDRVDVAGWSFPERHWEGNPLAGSDVAWDSPAPVIGLLHADIGEESSRYAPVSADDFAATADLWLLGHIHKPGRVRDARPEAWYPGSPHSLSSRETGAHGPLLVEVHSKHDIRVTTVPLSPVRFETLPIELNEERALTRSELQGKVSEQVRAFDIEHRAELEPVRHVGLALQLSGRARFEEAPEGLASGGGADEEFRSLEYGGRTYHLLTVEDLTRRPVADLEQMAQGGGPDGELAALILALRGSETAGEFANDILRETAEIAERVTNHPTYMEVSEEYPLPGEQTEWAEIVEEQAYRLLNTLMSQRS